MENYRTKAVVLSLVKYSENKLFVHLLTEKSGRESFVTYASRRNGSRRNLFQPLQIIEFKASSSRNGTIQTLSDVTIVYPLFSIYTDPRKSSIAMFIGELLYKLVIAPSDDGNMFDFIVDCILALEHVDEGCANFHLWFMVRFALQMGWAFPSNYENGSWLDIKNGIYSPFQPSHPQRISPKYAWIINKLCSLRIDTLSELKLSRDDRMHLLEALTDYYRYHSEAFCKINSLGFFHELLSPV